MEKREKVVEKMCECIFKDRQNTYGTPEDNFQTIADFWNIYLHNGDDIINKQDVAVMMMLLKIARMKSSPEHLDNYVDAAGYAVIAGSFVNDKK